MGLILGNIFGQVFKMNGFQSRNGPTTEKPFPGCLGRIVNLFDLSPGVAGNMLLTDKPHRDGSFLSILSFILF